MLEKDVFPKMAQEGVLSGCNLDSFWMDVGMSSEIFYLLLLRVSWKEPAYIWIL